MVCIWFWFKGPVLHDFQGPFILGSLRHSETISGWSSQMPPWNRPRRVWPPSSFTPLRRIKVSIPLRPSRNSDVSRDIRRGRERREHRKNVKMSFNWSFFFSIAGGHQRAENLKQTRLLLGCASNLPNFAVIAYLAHQEPTNL